MCNNVIINRLKALEVHGGFMDEYVEWVDIQEIIDEFEVKE